MTGEQKPGGLEVAGHFYQTAPGQWTQMNEADGSTVALTPAEPAEARVRELERERDTWKALAENGARQLPVYVAQLAKVKEGLGRIERSKSRTFGHLQSIARQTLAALQQEGE